VKKVYDSIDFVVGSRPFWRALVKTMVTDPAWEAMTMLDFPEGRTYEIAPDTKVLIRPSDVELALKNAISEKAPPRTETQRFIIDRYFFVSPDAWTRCSSS
jgi:hypothetical protein